MKRAALSSCGLLLMLPVLFIAAAVGVLGGGSGVSLGLPAADKLFGKFGLMKAHMPKRRLFQNLLGEVRCVIVRHVSRFSRSSAFNADIELGTALHGGQTDHRG